MAKHRALAGAFSIVCLGATSAIFACRRPDSADPFTAGDGADEEPQTDARAEASSDANTGDGAADGLAAAPDSPAYTYPLSRCSVSRDVFYLDVEGPEGPLQHGEVTQTTTSANWFVELQPELNVMLETETGPVGSIQVWTPSLAPIVPGTYRVGPSSTGPSIDIVVVDEGCHVSSGSFTVLDLQYDWPDTSTMGTVTSLLLSFDLVCGVDTLRGCVRYSR